MPSSFTCPNCGAKVPRHAKACPECGSDEETGWSDEARVGGLDLPDDNFEYEKFVEKEFGGNQPASPAGSWLWWFIGVLLLAALLRGWLK